AQHAWRGNERAVGRGGESASRQVLHPREFRSDGAEPPRHRQELAPTARHARLPLYLQPATPAGLVERRLARLVLGRLREGGASGRPAVLRLLYMRGLWENLAPTRQLRARGQSASDDRGLALVAFRCYTAVTF